MQYQIQELSIGGILDHSLRLFRDNFKLFGVILLVFLFPAQVFFTVTQTIFAPTPYAIETQEVDPNLLMESFGTFYLFLGIGILVTMLVYPLAQAAIMYGVANRYIGHDVTVGECFAVGLRRWPKVVVAGLLVGIAVGLGFVACFVPGIILLLMLYIVLPIIIFENAGIGEAFGRSQKLMKGHKRRVLNVIVLVGIINIALSVSLQLIPGLYVNAVAAAAVNSLFLAFNCIVTTVVYFSARCKVENFDLELLTSAVETQTSREQPSTL